MKDSKIQWTDNTWNPWIGCSKVHTGCKNCYAEADMDKRRKRVVWGPNGTRSRTSDDYWRQPLAWNRGAWVHSECGHRIAFGRVGNKSLWTCPTHGECSRDECEQNPDIRQRVFCASLADVFENWWGTIIDSKGEQLFYPHNAFDSKTRYVPASETAGDEPAVTMDCLRQDLFRLIDRTPNLDWLLLTKRPENVRRMWYVDDAHKINLQGVPQIVCAGRNNVWIGTSVSDQETADKAIPELLKCRDLAPVLFLSAEPLLGPIDLAKCLAHVDWVIVGGESGPKARRCDQEWIGDIVIQCRAAGVPCFVKQMGSFIGPGKCDDPALWPEALRVQDFPRLVEFQVRG